MVIINGVNNIMNNIIFKYSDEQNIHITGASDSAKRR